MAITTIQITQRSKDYKNPLLTQGVYLRGNIDISRCHITGKILVSIPSESYLNSNLFFQADNNFDVEITGECD
jgi:hypothetical protein